MSGVELQAAGDYQDRFSLLIVWGREGKYSLWPIFFDRDCTLRRNETLGLYGRGVETTWGG